MLLYDFNLFICYDQLDLAAPINLLGQEHTRKQAENPNIFIFQIHRIFHILLTCHIIMTNFITPNDCERETCVTYKQRISNYIVSWWAVRAV